MEVGISAIFRALLGRDGVFPRQHLDERVALIVIDDACLHYSKVTKDISQFVILDPAIWSACGVRSGWKVSLLT